MELRDETPIQTSQWPATSSFIGKSYKIHDTTTGYHATYIGWIFRGFLGDGGKMGIPYRSIPQVSSYDEDTGSMGSD